MAAAVPAVSEDDSGYASDSDSVQTTFVVPSLHASHESEAESSESESEPSSDSESAPDHDIDEANANILHLLHLMLEIPEAGDGHGHLNAQQLIVLLQQLAVLPAFQGNHTTFEQFLSQFGYSLAIISILVRTHPEFSDHPQVNWLLRQLYNRAALRIQSLANGTSFLDLVLRARNPLVLRHFRYFLQAYHLLDPERANCFWAAWAQSLSTNAFGSYEAAVLSHFQSQYADLIQSIHQSPMVVLNAEHAFIQDMLLEFFAPGTAWGVNSREERLMRLIALCRHFVSSTHDPVGLLLVQQLFRILLEFQFLDILGGAEVNDTHVEYTETLVSWVAFLQDVGPTYRTRAAVVRALEERPRRRGTFVAAPSSLRGPAALKE